MKRAYVVTGPEGAGNRMLAAILVAGGCHGTGSTDSPYNRALPQGESPAVIIRSLPHGGSWPDLASCFAELIAGGYQVTALLTAREPTALFRSQVAAGHQATERDAEDATDQAYRLFFASLHGQDVDWLLVPYEGLVLNPGLAIPALLERLGLDPDVPTNIVRVDHGRRVIVDQNAKHYQRGVACPA